MKGKRVKLSEKVKPRVSKARMKFRLNKTGSEEGKEGEVRNEK